MQALYTYTFADKGPVGPLHRKCTRSLYLDVLGDIDVQHPPYENISTAICQRCPDRRLPTPPPKTHVAVLLSPWLQHVQEYNSMAVIIAHLLRQGHDVTVLYGNIRCVAHQEKYDLLSYIHDLVLSSLPCHIIEKNSMHFRSKQIDVVWPPLYKGRKDPRAPWWCQQDKVPLEKPWLEHSPYQVLQWMDPEAQMTRSLLQGRAPDVMLIDANHVGALLVAEQFHIPVVTLANRQYMDLVLVDFYWRSYTLETLYHFFASRLASIFYHSGPFMKLNRARSIMGLRPLDTLTEVIYSQSLTTLVDSFHSLEFPADNLPPIPPQVHFVGPLLPECIACQGQGALPAGEARQVTIFILSLDLDLPQARSLLRGLSLVRLSLQSQYDKLLCEDDDDDDDDDTVKDCDHLRKVSRFQVVWQMRNETAFQIKHNLATALQDQLLPDYVNIVTGRESPLHHLASYPESALILSHCGMEAQRLLATDLPLVCVPPYALGRRASEGLASLSGGQVVKSVASQPVADAVHKVLTFTTKKRLTTMAWGGGGRAAQILGVVANRRTLNHGAPLTPTEKHEMKMAVFRKFPSYFTAFDWFLFLGKWCTAIAWMSLGLLSVCIFLWLTPLAPPLRRWVVLGDSFYQTLDVLWEQFHHWLSNEDLLAHKVDQALRSHQPPEPPKESTKKGNRDGQQQRRKKGKMKR